MLIIIVNINMNMNHFFLSETAFFLLSSPQNHPAASKLPLKDSFTFDDYR